jgi:5-hydroxyisourate hydrolase-like protein (transthyretin family)
MEFIMKKKTNILITIMLLVGAFSAQSALGYTIHIDPQDAFVEPGASLDFNAQAYSNDRTPVAVERYEWKVMPNHLGTISPEGLFSAGEKAGVGRITASAAIGGKRYVGTAVVNVGAADEKGIKISIEPNQAIVGPGKVQNFKAIAHGPNGISLRGQNIRWTLEPKSLGKIDHNGQFKAGERYGMGKVMALVEIDHQVYWGHATVIVSEKPTSAIAGTVIDELDAPLQEVKITASRIGIPQYSRKMRTAEDGTYLLDKLIAGDYVVKAEMNGYVPEYFENKKYLVEANLITVANEDTVNAVNFQLEKGGSISGQITNAEDGSPIKDTNITAFVRLNPSNIIFTKSDVDGNYFLEGLNSGSYIVKANKAGYNGEFYDDQKEIANATTVDVDGSSETVGINFDLEKTSAITGLITSDVDGSPIPKATVYIRALMTDTPQKLGKRLFQKTNENGEYTVQVKAGVYLVEAFAEGFASEWFDNASTPSEAELVQVTEIDHAEANMALAPLGTVSGIVTDQETGGPLMGAKVSAFSEQKQQNHKRHFKALTDETGAFTFTGLPAGDYYITSQARNYLPEFWQEADSAKNADIVTVANGSEIPDVNFTLSKGAAISGTVVDSVTNAPVANAQISLKKLNGRLKLSAKTNSDGNFNFNGLPSGEYVVRADHREYYKEWYNEQSSQATADTINVTAPDSVEGVNFTLMRREQAGAGIAGTVIDATTELPIDGAMVAVMPLSFATPKRIVTGEDGTFEMLGLKPGKYIVIAHAENYKGEFFENQKSWFNATPVTVSQDQVTPDINFALDPQEEGLYMVSGTITDEAGTPVEGALILAEEAGEIAATEVSESDGTYHMNGLPAGNYKLTASKVAYEDGAASTETVELSNGENSYDVSITLSSTSTDVETSVSQPTDFSLSQNYPNPFNPTTTIHFALPNNSNIKLTVFNVLGREVKLLETGYKQAGSFTSVWDGTDNNGNKLSSGLYIYRLEAQSESNLSIQTKRMLMLK